MPNKEFYQPETDTHHHSPTELLRIRSAVQSGLMRMYSKKHKFEEGPTSVPLAMAWSGSYAKAFGDLYEDPRYPEFSKMVDECNGSDESLEKIQAVLEDETGHH